MKVLIVGNGGRESALAWKIAQSPMVEEIFIAPGNGGTATENKCKNIAIDADDIAGLLEFATKNSITLVVVGPEVPLSLGIVDLLEANGIKVFGPCQSAAQLEASKAFAKDVMVAAKVPTAEYKQFTKASEAISYIKEKGTPIVVKADGLAAGKGVYIANTEEEAINAVDDILIKHIFGPGNAKVVVEEFLVGLEVSYLAITDGETIIPLASAQDHKAAFEGGKGPNTGGMGAYSPTPIIPDEQYANLAELVIRPIIDELKKRDIIYKGILYAGIMVCNGEGDTLSRIKVLEYNSRFGDPETQVILPKMSSDLASHLLAVAESRLGGEKIEWHSGAVATVVMASGGYPNDYETGFPITGIDEAKKVSGVLVFHAGTMPDANKAVSAGGRVLNVTGIGSDLRDALGKAYQGIEKIHFEKAYYRKDIGYKILK